MLSKLIIVLFLIAIVFCLGSALYYLLHDHGDSRRMAKMLTLRITLSLILFFALIVGFATGLLHPNSIALYAPIGASAVSA